MLSPFIVPAKPVSQLLDKFGAGFVAFQIDSLVLQGTPEPLDKNIVFETAFAVHADPHLPLFQHFGERLAGELAALVAVEYFGRAPYWFSASLSASTQNRLSSVLDKRQLSTFLLAQSMMATRYMNPLAIGM